jgi:hypothetical protein
MSVDEPSVLAGLSHRAPEVNGTGKMAEEQRNIP